MTAVVASSFFTSYPPLQSGFSDIITLSPLQTEPAGASVFTSALAGTFKMTVINLSSLVTSAPAEVSSIL